MKYQKQGARLRQVREASGLTQEDVGRHLGISGPAVRHYETGRSRPDPETAEALDSLFGTGGEIAGLYRYAAGDADPLTVADLARILDGRADEVVAALVELAKTHRSEFRALRKAQLDIAKELRAVRDELSGEVPQRSAERGPLPRPSRP